jgi:hypothetical protein
VIGLVPLRIRKPSDPQPPTVTDLLVYGPDVCLAALREEFAEHHKRWGQYAGWTENTTLGIVARRIGGGETFVRAEPGDLVLIKRGRYRGWALSGLHSDDVAYCPRVGWNVSIAHSLVLPVGETA